jgi:hypothetical protein
VPRSALELLDEAAVLGLVLAAGETLQHHVHHLKAGKEKMILRICRKKQSFLAEIQKNGRSWFLENVGIPLHALPVK